MVGCFAWVRGFIGSRRSPSESSVDSESSRSVQLGRPRRMLAEPESPDAGSASPETLSVQGTVEMRSQYSTAGISSRSPSARPRDEESCESSGSSSPTTELVPPLHTPVSRKPEFVQKTVVTLPPVDPISKEEAVLIEEIVEARYQVLRCSVAAGDLEADQERMLAELEEAQNRLRRLQEEELESPYSDENVM